MGSSQLQYTILPGSVKDMGVYLFIRQGSVSMSGGASPLTFWGVCDKCMFHISNGNQIYITLHKRRFFSLPLSVWVCFAPRICTCVWPCVSERPLCSRVRVSAVSTWTCLTRDRLCCAHSVGHVLLLIFMSGPGSCSYRDIFPAYRSQWLQMFSKQLSKMLDWFKSKINFWPGALHQGAAFGMHFLVNTLFHVLLKNCIVATNYITRQLS